METITNEAREHQEEIARMMVRQLVDLEFPETYWFPGYEEAANKELEIRGILGQIKSEPDEEDELYHRYFLA